MFKTSTLPYGALEHNGLGPSVHCSLPKFVYTFVGPLPRT